MKIKAYKRAIIYIIPAVLIGISDRYSISIYAVFFIASLYDVASFISANREKNEHLLNICLYSTILPDNYSVIVSLALCVALCKKQKTKQSDPEKLFLIWISLRTAFSLVHPLNVAFTVFYWITLLLCVQARANLFRTTKSDYISKQAKTIIIVEYIAVSLRALLQNGFHNLDMDWVYGTLGITQGVQLFMIMISFGVFFFKRYSERKKRDDLIWGILSSFLGLLTGSVALTLLLAAALLIYVIIYASFKKKIVGLIAVAFVFIILIFSNQSWVYNDIIHLTDIKYLTNRVQKIDTYKMTFIEIPKQDPIFLLFGEGLGRFSSRAAITLSGEYLDAVKLTDMSTYTEKYILPSFLNAKINNIGTAYMPFSEICTIAGEAGVVALVLFFLCLRYRFKKSNKYQKIYLLIIIVFLLYDNFLEFPRTVFVYFLIYNCMNNSMCCSNRIAISTGKKGYLYV